MAINFKYGDTYYCSYTGIVGTHLYKPGLCTIEDPSSTIFSIQPTASSQLIRYHPLKGPMQYHWMDELHIREASTSDFQVGDVITENSLGIFNAEIIEIKLVGAFITDPPIVADQLDPDGTKTGCIFHLEPYECIMVEKLNEDTLDLHLETKEPQPKDNQGRKFCYWCSKKTKIVQGFHLETYNVCPKCHK